MESRKTNDENFGPYWTEEARPGVLWSRGCALTRTIPPSKFLRYDAPVLDRKVCDNCGAVIDDPYNTMSAADIRASTRYGSLWCSTCVKESKEAYVKQRVPGPGSPARCTCGFFLKDCRIADNNPPCPGWDSYPAPANWTLRFPTKVRKLHLVKNQSDLFQ